MTDMLHLCSKSNASERAVTTPSSENANPLAALTSSITLLRILYITFRSSFPSSICWNESTATMSLALLKRFLFLADPQSRTRKGPSYGTCNASSKSPHSSFSSGSTLLSPPLSPTSLPNAGCDDNKSDYSDLVDEQTTLRPNGDGDDDDDDYNDDDIEAQLPPKQFEDPNERGCRVNARIVSDAIIGLSDGLTVPFALTAGLSALGDTTVVVYGGLAELIAGAISMGLGGYLGARSEAYVAFPFLPPPSLFSLPIAGS